MRMKRILVPVDFSEEAELAVEWAVRLGKEERNAEIILLHNLNPIFMSPDAGLEIGQLIEERAKKTKEDLVTWSNKIPAPLASFAIFKQGDLVNEICSTCQKKNVDLVVMTTHGRQGLSRIMHPNVTEKVVRSAPCPILVLHLTPKMKECLKPE